MSPDDLGPMPEPHKEPRDPNPGGVDAIDAVPGEEPAIPDLDPDSNPAVDAEPLEMKESEDTSTEATKQDDTDRDGQESDESPA